MNKKNESNLNRRNFIQKLGVGAAAVGAFSLTSCGIMTKAKEKTAVHGKP